MLAVGYSQSSVRTPCVTACVRLSPVAPHRPTYTYRYTYYIRVLLPCLDILRVASIIPGRPRPAAPVCAWPFGLNRRWNAWHTGSSSLGSNSNTSTGAARGREGARARARSAYLLVRTPRCGRTQWMCTLWRQTIRKGVETLNTVHKHYFVCAIAGKSVVNVGEPPPRRALDVSAGTPACSWPMQLVADRPTDRLRPRHPPRLRSLFPSMQSELGERWQRTRTDDRTDHFLRLERKTGFLSICLWKSEQIILRPLGRVISAAI